MLTEAEQKELESLRKDWGAWAKMTLEPKARRELERLIELERRDASQRIVKIEPTIADPTLERKTHATDPERRYDVRRNCIPIIVDETEPTLERIPNLRRCGAARARTEMDTEPEWRRELIRRRVWLHMPKLEALDALRTVVLSGQGQADVPMEVQSHLGLSRCSPTLATFFGGPVIGGKIWLVIPGALRNKDFLCSQVLDAIDAAGGEIVRSSK